MTTRTFTTRGRATLGLRACLMPSHSSKTIQGISYEKKKKERNWSKQSLLGLAGEDFTLRWNARRLDFFFSRCLSSVMPFLFVLVFPVAHVTVVCEIILIPANPSIWEDWDQMNEWHKQEGSGILDEAIPTTSCNSASFNRMPLSPNAHSLVSPQHTAKYDLEGSKWRIKGSLVNLGCLVVPEEHTSSSIPWHYIPAHSLSIQVQTTVWNDPSPFPPPTTHPQTAPPPSKTSQFHSLSVWGEADLAGIPCRGVASVTLLPVQSIAVLGWVQQDLIVHWLARNNRLCWERNSKINI